MPNMTVLRRISALAALLASTGLACADPWAEPVTSSASADPDAVIIDLSEPAPATPLTAEEQAALSDALNSLEPPERARPVRERSAAPGAPANWQRTDKLDGSTDVSVKKPLPVTWDSSVGADFALAPASAGVPGKPPMADRDTSAAWAKVQVPGVAAIDARVEPGADANKLGASLSRSLPVGGDVSMTLQNTTTVTQPAGAAAAPVWSTDRGVKFDFGRTGTSLGVGTVSSSADGVTHNKLSAEQKLTGALSLSTAVTDPGGKAESRSVGLGYKMKW
jgi:hypothetical protein